MHPKPIFVQKLEKDFFSICHLQEQMFKKIYNLQHSNDCINKKNRILLFLKKQNMILFKNLI